MSDSNYIKIYTGDMIIVRRILAELETVDISAVVKDQTESARLGGFGGGIFPGFQEVFVNKDELEKATKIIDDITSELEA
ncbi:MAG: putative signal transducing protein [Flavobacteriaceae bacterium]